MVGGRDRVGRGGAPGRVDAEPVAEPGDHPGLVLRQPETDAVAEPARHDLDVLAEGIDGAPLDPAARVFEGGRKIPVIERDERLDLVLEQLVDHAVVEVEPRLVDATAALGQDPRPRDREPERRRPELTQQRDVVAIAVVEVAGGRAALAVANLAGRRTEAIPDALAAAVEIGRPLDLVGGGARAPEEPRREAVLLVGIGVAHSLPHVVGPGASEPDK